MNGKNLHSRPFLIGFDSDGCVFDNMTVKHRRCFGPEFIECYGLNAVAGRAADIWDFVNLFGRTRGCNRFRGVIHSLHWLEQCPDVTIPLPDVSGLKAWADQASNLSNSALEEYRKSHPSPELDRALEWSCGVNRRISALNIEFPPIAGVREAFADAERFADLTVISQAPSATVEHEWHRHGIDSSIARICGQESGSKADQLRSADDGFYAPGRLLLVGDAPGDRAAAAECGALFYPIVPGREAESWREFRTEALPRFFAGTYAGAYQDSKLSAFESALPEKPDFIP